MPTYEYECTKCGRIVELFQPITEPPRKRLKKADPKPCKCDAPVRRRIGTGGGLIFKGSGFYHTDYRSDSYKKAAKAETEPGKTAESKGSEKKSDAKSDTKKGAPKKGSESKASQVA